MISNKMLLIIQLQQNPILLSERIIDVGLDSNYMMEVQHNVIPMVTTFVVQNGDFVGSLQNIVIARNVLTLGKVAP